MSFNTSRMNILNTISNDLNRYLGIVIFLFGSIGNTLNILVLSQRTIRSNPCALLFLASSISNLIGILFGLLSRILSGWNLDPTNNILLLCKLRILVSFASRTAAYWFIALAAIDRWLSISIRINYRQMSTIKNAQRSTIVILTLSTACFVYAPICYQIRPNNMPQPCAADTKLCRITIDLIYGLITISLPILLMNVFSFKTISNIRLVKNRIQPFEQYTSQLTTVLRVNTVKEEWKITDQRLVRMLFTQIILFTLFSFPIVIQRVYTTATMNNRKSDWQNTLENFIFTFVLLLSFLANGIPFYIYTLTGGSVFRKALINVIYCKY